MDQNAFLRWQAPAHWQRFTTLECHTGGEPLRIITSGFPELRGSTILERRRDCLERYDHLRTALMFEPRGHADMYGCLIVPPERTDSDFGVLFLHNEGYSTMCGHAIIALVRAAIESGAVKKCEPLTCLRIDTPAGQVCAYAGVAGDEITGIWFDNVPSFVLQQEAEVQVPGWGSVRTTLAFGGAFYAYVDAPSIDLSLDAANHKKIIAAGRSIKHAVQASAAIVHPYQADLSFLYGVIFTAPSQQPDVHSRQVCIFADGELDRSPTGTGVSGRAAILHVQGELGLGQGVTIESILGSRFQVSVQQTTRYGDYDAVIPRVAGDAHIVGQNCFYLDPSDPLQHGFIFR